MTISAEELFESVRRAAADGETVTLTVNSGSMRPFLDAGDRVTLSASTAYRRGDIVLAKCGDEAGCRTVVLHTVERREGEELILRGAANLYRRERANVADVAARVIRVERGGRRVDADSRLWRFALRSWPASSFFRRIFLWVSSFI